MINNFVTSFSIRCVLIMMELYLWLLWYYKSPQPREGKTRPPSDIQRATVQQLVT